MVETDALAETDEIPTRRTTRIHHSQESEVSLTLIQLTWHVQVQHNTLLPVTTCFILLCPYHTLAGVKPEPELLHKDVSFNSTWWRNLDQKNTRNRIQFKGKGQQVFLRLSANYLQHVILVIRKCTPDMYSRVKRRCLSMHVPVR